MSMKSRYISVRPNNVNSDSTISFKSGLSNCVVDNSRSEWKIRSP